MSSLPVKVQPDEIGHLLNRLLACAPEDVPAWINTYHPRLNLQFLQTLKDNYAITTYILAEPQKADRATRYGLLIAERMIGEPLALPLTRWARGLYEMFHAPEKAIEYFQQAQSAYHAAGKELTVARLNANLVGVFTECGRFAEAEIAYQAALPELAIHIDKQPLYLLRLEQNYGWLLHSQGRYGDALATLDRALQLARQHNLPNSITGIQVNRHLALGMLGRLDEVEAGLWEERTAAFSQRQILTVARIDMNLGDLYTWQGRVAAAFQRFQAAQQSFVVLDNEMEVASVLFRQAALLSRIGARRAAIRHYAQALPIFKQRGMFPQVGELLVNYATAQRREGEYRQSAVLLAEATEIWRKLANPLWSAKVLIERIALAMDQEKFSEAQRLLNEIPTIKDVLNLQAQRDLLRADLTRLITFASSTIAQVQQAYERARSYASAHGERWIERHALAGLGKLWLKHDPVRSAAYFEQAAEIDNAMRQTLTVEELKASFHEQTSDLFDDQIRQAVEQSHGPQSLHLVWRAKASPLLDLFNAIQNEATLPSATKYAIQQTRQQIATLRWQQATQADPSQPQPVQEQNNVQIVELEQQLLDLRRLRNAAPYESYPSFTEGAVNHSSKIIARMDVDLLLEYARCGDDIFGIVANRDGDCNAVHLIDVETITDLHARLQLRFGNVVAQPSERRMQWNQQWLSECLPLLEQCYQFLVAPLLATLPDSATATRVLIAPCDPLFLLPFAAFWNGQQFWAETCQIESIPSGALLGNSVPVASLYSSPIVIAASTGKMTAVYSEANCIVSALPDSIAFIDRPSLPYLKELQSPPKILHIAAHSLLRADAPLFTGLQLAGEVLTVEQSYELPLRGTQLVALSGCTTASGQESESALLAFQNAFLLAGAQRVLTTLWPISDDATALWMKYFYDYIASNMTIPHALQQTQQHCLANPALSHPAIWAPFSLTRR